MSAGKNMLPLLFAREGPVLSSVEWEKELVEQVHLGSQVVPRCMTFSLIGFMAKAVEES